MSQDDKKLMRKHETSPPFSTEKWIRFSTEHKDEAAMVMQYAEELLAFERITPEGVKRAIASPAMNKLRTVLLGNPHLQDCLGIRSLEPARILCAIDVYAAQLIFHHEGQHS